MQKITTYSPDQKRSPFAFFILSKGMNSGKPLEHPCPNCFTFNASDQVEKDHYFWLCFGLWQSKSLHPYLIGSVIPFIHLRDLNQVINQASEKALAAPANFQKTVEVLKILDQHEKQFSPSIVQFHPSTGKPLNPSYYDTIRSYQQNLPVRFQHPFKFY